MSNPNTITADHLADKVAELIYKGLCKQAFVDWHAGTFVDHIGESAEFAPSKEKIIEDIKRLFNL